jgi:outer membrane biosynthesis protein TonB
LQQSINQDNLKMQAVAKPFQADNSLFKKYDVYLLALIAELLLLGSIAFIIAYHFKPVTPKTSTINLMLNEQTPDIPEEKERPKPTPTPIVKEKNNKPQKVQEKPNIKELPLSNTPSEIPYQAPIPTQSKPSESNTTNSAQSNKSDIKPDPMLRYQGQVRAAIQSAVRCSSAANEMNLSGKTRVQFNLKDSVQTGAHVATGSGIPMLDNIAITAVQNAKYPSPPEEFAGENKTMTVLVNLNCNN